ncbi:MAG: hypothetical protein ISR95_08015 [Candidatus Marinimicrobia bacterium]|nr:hypothetical protein [Candidatus Neomarinimicrobiota bacterium]
MKLKTIIHSFLAVFLILPLLNCSNTGTSNQQDPKLEAISREQKIILSRLESIDKNQKDIQKSIADLGTSIRNVQTAVGKINTNPPVAQNDQNKPDDADKVFDIPIGNSVVLGPKDAKVTITEWMDFQ